jgi:hypothetical protein
MNDPPLAKPRHALLAVSLLLVAVLFLAVLEGTSLIRQGWSEWLQGWLRPLAVFFFTFVALYLLNGRSPKVAKQLQRLRLSLLIPALEEFVRNQKRSHANHLVAERMAVTLAFYRLKVQNVSEPPASGEEKQSGRLLRLWRRWRPLPARDQTSCQQRAAVAMPLVVMEEEDRIRNCAELLGQCGVVTVSGLPLTIGQLCLIYREQHRLETLLWFQSVRRADPSHELLAQILLDSEQLPEKRRLSEPPLHKPFSKVEVAAVLEKLSDFKVAELIAELKKRQRQVANYEMVAGKMHHALEYFGLTFPEDAREALLDDACPDEDQDKVIAHCALAVGGLLEKPPSLLELFYRELYRLDTAVLYRRLEPDLPYLASTLLRSPWLPPRWQSHSFSQIEVEAVLKDMADFDLKELQNKLLRRQQQVSTYQTIADQMHKMVTDFDLGTLQPKAYEKLMRNAVLSDDPDTQIAHCAAGIGELVDQPEQTLALLYRDHQRLAQPANWQQHIPQLARTLTGNPRLPTKELAAGNSEPFSQEEICRALQQLHRFSLVELVEQLMANEAKRREGHVILRRMAYTLHYYSLFGRLHESATQRVGENGEPAFSRDFQQSYCVSLPDLFDTDDYTTRCATAVARQLAPGNELPAASELIELVYRERNGLPTADLWFKRRSTLVPGLANLLAGSDKLPDPSISMPYTPLNLQELLQEHEDFSLNFVRDEVDHVTILWRLAAKYRDFLRVNEIQGWELKTDDLIALLKPLPTERSQLPQLITRELDVLRWAGEKSIRASFPEAGPHLYSYGQVSLAIFLSAEADRHSRELLAQICREMAAGPDDTAIRISLAYVDLTADLEGRQQADDRDFVTVRSLIETWAERDRHLHDQLKGYHKEIASLRGAFHRGQWLTHLWKALTQTISDLKNSNAPVKALVENREHLIESLRRIFMRLDVRTIERYLEARTITAYLIAFDSTKGSLAGLLDSFMRRPETIVAENNAERQKQQMEAFWQLQRLGVHLQTEDGSWLYNFCQYTFNTRIGVLPHGWNLRQFWQVFSQDMATVASASEGVKQILAPDHDWRNDLEATEVILHRFGLRNHYALELESRSENAVSNMKSLFATHIEFDDLLATISYEQLEMMDIAAAIMQGTIPELAFDHHMHSRERAKLDRHDTALKLMLLLRHGNEVLSGSKLAVLDLPLGKNQLERISQKVQEDVLSKTVERILRRHTPATFGNEEVQPGSLLLTCLAEMVGTLLQQKRECVESQIALGALPLQIETLLGDHLPATDRWTLELITLAVMQNIDCLVLNEEEQGLLDQGVEELAHQLATDADGMLLDSAVNWLAEAMVDLVPRINGVRCQTVARSYVSTLRDAASLARDL